MWSLGYLTLEGRVPGRRHLHGDEVGGRGVGGIKTLLIFMKFRGFISLSKGGKVTECRKLRPKRTWYPPCAHDAAVAPAVCHQTAKRGGSHRINTLRRRIATGVLSDRTVTFHRFGGGHLRHSEAHSGGAWIFRNPGDHIIASSSFTGERPDSDFTQLTC